jgi:hypothetical protein
MCWPGSQLGSSDPRSACLSEPHQNVPDPETLPEIMSSGVTRAGTSGNTGMARSCGLPAAIADLKERPFCTGQRIVRRPPKFSRASVPAGVFGARVRRIRRRRFREGDNCVKSLRKLKVMLAAGLGLVFLLAGPVTTTGAQASTLSYLCDLNTQCWVNHGPGNEITTTTGNYGTGWAAEKVPGVVWNHHQMYDLVAGDGSCAFDLGSGYVLGTEPASYCRTYVNDFFYLAPSGAFVNDYATGQAGHFECLIVLGSGLLGNFACPSGQPPPDATFEFEPA